MRDSITMDLVDRANVFFLSFMVAAWIVGWSSPLGAEETETIYDPENPGVSEEDDSESSEEDEGGVEVIQHGTGSEGGKDESDGADDENDETRRDSGSASGAGGVASRSTFRGTWRTGLGIDTAWGEREDIVEWQSSLGLHLEYDISSTSRVVVDGDFRHWAAGRKVEDGPNLLVNAAEPRAAFEARLGESYLLLRSDRWTFRIGHLITSWGSTSLVSPADVVNPIDATDVSTTGGGGSAARPQMAAELGYVTPDWSLEAVLVPFFEPNRVTVFGRDTAVVTPNNPLVGDQFPIVSIFQQVLDRSLYEEAQPLLLATSVPDELPGNASAGLRATATTWNTDIGVGYFFGWDRTPSISIDEDTRRFVELVGADGEVLQNLDLQGFLQRNPEALGLLNTLAEKQRQGETLLSSTYRRKHSFVLDVSRYVGPVGVRADLALSPERTFVTRDFASVRRTTAFGALGLSWERLIDGRPLALTLEGYGLQPFARDSAINEFFVGSAERGSADQQLALVGNGLYGLAGAVQWRLPFWKLDLQLGGLGDLSNGGVVASGRLRRQWTSWLRTSLGAVVYEGRASEESLSIGGLYDRNDRVDLVVDGTF